MGAVAVCLVLGIARPAYAQRVLTFGGTGSQAVVNQPVNTANSVVPPNRLGGFHLQSLFHPFAATNFGGPPTVGTSPLPHPGLFRSAHYGNSLNPFAPTKQEIQLNKQGLMPKTFTIVHSSQ
jgi:hypothetical protein